MVAALWKITFTSRFNWAYTSSGRPKLGSHSSPTSGTTLSSVSFVNGLKIYKKIAKPWKQYNSFPLFNGAKIENSNNLPLSTIIYPSDFEDYFHISHEPAHKLFQFLGKNWVKPLAKLFQEILWFPLEKHFCSHRTLRWCSRLFDYYLTLCPFGWKHNKKYKNIIML